MNHWRHQLIDNNGEIVSEQIGKFESPLNEDGYRIPAHKSGARIFEGVSFPEALTFTEIGRLTLLAKSYMVGESNMLGYRRGKNIYAYTTSEIGALVGLNSGSKCRGFIAKMVKLRVLHKVIDTAGNPQIYVNPAYFMANGKRLSLNLFLLFKDDLVDLLPPWVLENFLGQAREKELAANPDEWLEYHGIGVGTAEDVRKAKEA